MDDLTTKTSTQNTTQSPQQPPKKPRTSKALLLLLVLVLLAGGIAGGYFWGKMNKNQEVDQAKHAAEQKAQHDSKTGTGDDVASSQTQKNVSETSD